MEAKQVFGDELQVGDTIEIFWSNGRDTVMSLKPYTGPLECLKGSRIAEFAFNQGGMTVPPCAVFALFARSPSMPHVE